MADKRISQLIERVDIANNDVLPIVASGATTTNKVTVSTLQDWMQDNLDVGVTSVGITIGSTGTDVNVTGSPVTSSGNITINIPTASATNRGLLSSANWTTFNNKVSSVGLSMPSAFSVANSPITGSGTIAVTGAGTVSQYIRGDGSLADFPSGGGGGGASVNYYLNGSVSQGTIGGIAYQEMNKVPVLGAGTDFVAIADGYLASFITDAGDPGLLEIPGGNWNFETYFSASSGGGTPTFYIELYKVNSGGTATLIASNSGTPELIAFGTTITPYFSTLAVPTTALAITDRLALRYYVARSGRTITLHTENSHLCQIITTFTTGLTALNGLTAQVQNFATGTSGTDFAISSSVSTHTFNLPDASASARGVVTTGTQTFAGYKIFTGTISANNDIQLAAAGTASTTFIKNISGAGLTSVGSNGFGFNNSDNIYFSGSNKGGGIIAFSNTGNQTYTLQDASGTLAFTSDIPSLAGYVTLATTQTITGAKTFDTTTSNFLILNSTNASGGALTFRRNGTNVGHIGNSGVLGVGILDDLEVRSGIGKGLHLKTDGGKLTLSAGGSVTLDGALNGTSITLSGDYNSTSNSGSLLWSGATNKVQLNANAGTLDFYTGTSSYTKQLSISPTGAATFSSSVTATAPSNGVGLQINGRSSDNIGQILFYANNGTTLQNYIQSRPAFLAINTETNTPIYFGTNLGSGGNTRMTITGSGKVGIGTDSPDERLEVSTFGNVYAKITSTTNGGNAGIRLNSTNAREFGIFSDGDLRFYDFTAATDRMRITSVGYLKASNDGVYLGGSLHELLNNTSNGYTLIVSNKAASPASTYIQDWRFTASTPNNSSARFWNCEDATANRAYMLSNGGLANYATNNVVLSDERLKKDIEPLESYWDKFKAIEIVKYKFKDQTHDDFNIGVIAQQVEAVAPEFVDVDGWDTKPKLDEEGNEIVSEEEPIKSVYASDLHHATIKVLQEAMAKIEKLETEIDSLKNQIK